jgi:hypothetical protein
LVPPAKATNEHHDQHDVWHVAEQCDESEGDEQQGVAKAENVDGVIVIEPADDEVPDECTRSVGYQGPCGRIGAKPDALPQERVKWENEA